VSWIKDPQPSASIYSADANTNFNRNVDRKNITVFGRNSSTQATRLAFAGENVSLVCKYYSEVLPHPSVHLLDHSSDKDISDNSALVTATTVKSFYHPGVGYLYGVSSLQASGGNAEFNDLTLFCYPGGNMTLKYAGTCHHLI
jgi:hypothetical protein